MTSIFTAPSHLITMRPILAVRQVAHEGLGSLELLFSNAGLKYQYVDPYRRAPGEFRPDDWSGLVVLGGPMNVDQIDEHPFLADEVRWIRQALDARLPMLGICLGAQLLAKTAGAKVYPNHTKEIGWYDLQLLPAATDDPLFSGLATEQTVFQWHGDTFDLPAGAVHLARGPLCEHQAFRFGPAAWGLQFHLEITAEAVDDWTSNPGNCCEVGRLEYIELAEIRRRTPSELPKMEQLSQIALVRFAELCRQRG